MVFYISKEEAKSKLEAFDPRLPASEIDGILEYYSIAKLYEQNNSQIPKAERKKLKYYDTVRQLREQIGRFLSTVSGSDFPSLFSQINNNDKQAFVKALVEYRVFERVTESDLSLFLEEHPHVFYYISCEKKLVDNYGAIIVKFLLHHVECAETVIRHFFEKHESDDEKTYMPDTLGEGEINIIIQRYVEWEHANVNYLQLISNLKKVGKNPINERTRYRALERVNEIWNSHNAVSSSGMTYGVEMRFREQSDEIIEEFDKENHVTKLHYSKNWISENLDCSTLLNNFIFLFKYVDSHGRCTFLSNPNQLSFFEQLFGVHSEREYRTGIGYSTHDMRSVIQMNSYRFELKNYGVEVESLFKWFFEEYLYSEFMVSGFHYFAPSPHASTLEKILLIASQLDATIKQLRLFMEDGEINRGLFEFSSMPYKIVETPSMIEKKYIYPNSKNLKADLQFLFSPHYLTKTTGKIKGAEANFVDYIKCHSVSISDYPKWEKDSLERLVKRQIIYTDENGHLRISKVLSKILFDLHYNGSIVYSYCTPREKCIVDQFLKNDDLIAESTLFTRQEQEYIDYMLNVQKFDNGPELRNKYVHGSFSLESQTYEQDYDELLKIMTLIVIKINEEFCLKNPRE